MATFEVDIDDGLVDTLRRHLPPGWTVDDWLSLKAEQAIAQTHLDQRRQGIQQAAQAAPGDVPDTALATNQDVQQARQDAADDADADAHADDD